MTTNVLRPARRSETDGASRSDRMVKYPCLAGSGANERDYLVQAEVTVRVVDRGELQYFTVLSTGRVASRGHERGAYQREHETLERRLALFATALV